MSETINTLLFIVSFLVALLVLGVILILFRRQEPKATEQSSPSAISGEPLQHQYSESALNVLTPRERDVALLAARGLSNRQIAGELGLSINTVSNHLKRVYGKLNVHSRAELAWQLQYVDLNPDPAPPDMGG
jgi:DNA-binding NarL/FixJ family response regulator